MKNNQKVAILTCKNLPYLNPSDQLFEEQLRDNGFKPQPVIWNDPEFNPKKFDFILFRLTWDYVQAGGHFLDFLEKLHKSEIPVWNSISLIKWNYKKSYLFEFESKGISIPETLLVLDQNWEEIKQKIFDLGWEKWVIKPLVSAGAFKTQLHSREDLTKGMNLMEWKPEKREMMVQRFYPEIQEEGEWSLIYFNGKFSHSLLKKPKKGDFRSQEEFGSDLIFQPPPLKMIKWGEKVLNFCPETPLYSRVDGISSKGQFFLMELELIEPELYMTRENLGARHFMNAWLEIVLKG